MIIDQSAIHLSASREFAQQESATMNINQLVMMPGMSNPDHASVLSSQSVSSFKEILEAEEAKSFVVMERGSVSDAIRTEDASVTQTQDGKLLDGKELLAAVDSSDVVAPELSTVPSATTIAGDSVISPSQDINRIQFFSFNAVEEATTVNAVRNVQFLDRQRSLMLSLSAMIAQRIQAMFGWGQPSQSEMAQGLDAADDTQGKATNSVQAIFDQIADMQTQRDNVTQWWDDFRANPDQALPGSAEDADAAAQHAGEDAVQPASEDGRAAMAGLGGNAFGFFDRPRVQTLVETEVSHYEREMTTFESSGMVRTADGHAFDFNMELAMEREQAEYASMSLLMDPLVINYDGTAAELSSDYMAFDLNADGDAELMPELTGGSGYLAYDKNGDGEINDGTELFGAKSGDGFGDLAEYDDDGNGWIDEADDIYSKLSLWGGNTDADIMSLQSQEIGALYLDHVNSQFHLTHGDDTLGIIQESSLAVKEDFSTVSVQKLDLAVKPHPVDVA